MGSNPAARMSSARLDEGGPVAALVAFVAVVWPLPLRDAMPPRTTTWRELVPGLILVGVVAAAVASLLIFAKVGAMHGKKATVYMVAGAARGVIQDTEVWLEGQKIGLVREITFKPVTSDTTARLVLTLDLLADDLPHLRRDAHAQIRAGGSLIGAPVIYISGGSSAATAVTDGDTLTMLPQGDTEGVTSQIALASRDFPEIIGNTKALSAHLNTARGTAGAVLHDARGSREVTVFRGRATSLVRQATRGRGTVALALAGDSPLLIRAKAAMARADSVRQLLDSPAGNLGRFQRDSTLLRTVASVRAEVSVARALLAEPRGTAGRVLADSAIVNQMTRMERDLGALMQDIKANPLRYIAF